MSQQQSTNASVANEAYVTKLCHPDADFTIIAKAVVDLKYQCHVEKSTSGSGETMGFRVIRENIKSLMPQKITNKQLKNYFLSLFDMRERSRQPQDAPAILEVPSLRSFELLMDICHFPIADVSSPWSDMYEFWNLGFLCDYLIIDPSVCNAWFDSWYKRFVGSHGPTMHSRDPRCLLWACYFFGNAAGFLAFTRSMAYDNTRQELSKICERDSVKYQPWGLPKDTIRKYS